jgi:NAD(P)-dependent dehydrogenase (short-subunit alcohol dehydrogenase family)
VAGGRWTPTLPLPYAGGMADQFKDRVAVITGGGSGIGAAMATAFAARGARLVLADIDAGALERTSEALRAGGADALTVRTDVGDLAQVRALADATVDRFGAVHVVCNNAGIALFGPMASATHADWEYTMRVDFWGVVHGVETFAPRLLAQGQGGHIVNTASMAGLVGMQWLGVYCAAKFAVVGLTESLHRELKPQGIGVSVLCPMIVQTDINRNSVRNRPAALRNPGDPLDFEEPGAEVQGAMKGGVIAVEEVARRVVRAIDRGDLYVLTHPEQREFLRRRAAKLDTMFETDRW